MRYPVTLTAPDGRRIICYDGEHAAAVHLLTSWLLWDKVGRFVRDRDGDVDWARLEAKAPLFASSERLLAAAAMDLYGTHPDGLEVATLRRLCQILDGEHLGRVLEAVCLLRPDAAPPGIGQALGSQVRWDVGGGGGG
jgi:hypothetical protein